MAAYFARCRSRVFQSVVAPLKPNSRNSTLLSPKTNHGACVTKRCVSLTGKLPLQPNRESLVQAVSKNFSIQASHGVWQSSITSCGMEATVIINPTTGSMEECSEEGEDEATSGRKRIKPYELQRDDP